MWICGRCKTANKDGYTQCVQCSAPRNTRRFGAGGSVPEEPGIAPQAAERRMQPKVESVEAPSPRRQPPSQPVKPRPFMAIARLIGGVMAVCLPLYVLLIAVMKLNVLMPIISGLFLDTVALPYPVTAYVLYAVSALLAMLLSAVPGLSLLTLAHLARGVRGGR